MEENVSNTESVDYDRERLASDPDYRDEVLDEIASDAPAAYGIDLALWALYVVVGLSLFTLGLFVGGYIGDRIAYYTALLLVCFVIVPLLGCLIVYKP